MLSRLPRRVRTFLCSTVTRMFPGFFSKIELNDPVFISGLGRSGTTLLMDVLEKHKQVVMFPNEANYLWHPYSYPWKEKHLQVNAPPFWIAPKEFTEVTMKKWDVPNTSKLMAAYGFFQYFNKKARFVNKSAMITFMLPFVKQLFPGAKFIIMIRDGRSAVYSYAKKQHAKILESPDAFKKQAQYGEFKPLLEMLSHNWLEHILFLNEFQKQLKSSEILFVRYEDLCNHPHKELEKIYSFMRIEERRSNLKNYNFISSQNYKAKDNVCGEDWNLMTKIMEPGLRKFDYNL